MRKKLKTLKRFFALRSRKNFNIKNSWTTFELCDIQLENRRMTLFEIKDNTKIIELTI